MSWYKLLGLILIAGLLSISCNQENKESPEASNTLDTLEQIQLFDWQGHRGARGLLAENTIPAMLKALEYPILTLELDVVISKDQKVVVSHEPWLSASICYKPDGATFEEKEGDHRYKLLEMNYEEIKNFNCGKKHEGFPEQEEIEVSKPLLSDLIDAVEKYCREKERRLPFYNIEIKSNPEWDNKLTPQPEKFASLVLEVLKEKDINERICIQSFDPRSLEAVHQLAPDLTTAYLVWQPASVASNLEKLSYVPPIYSPNYQLVSKNMVDTVHEKGMKVIPWTVNETELMEKLKEMGVDGIITDYPNRIPF